MKRYNYLLATFLLLYLFSSCQKSFLNEKPDQALLVPESLSDFQALLDNLNIMNVTPSLQNVATDDYYTTDNGWSALSSPAEKNSYIWLSDIYENQTNQDWNIPYKQVFYANVVLDGLNQIGPGNTSQNTYNQIKGSALFYRAFAEYNLIQMFAADYDPATASQLPGIPVRSSSDVNIKSTRGSIKETYEAIVADLNNAALLLSNTAAFKSRPCKTAVYALLSKIYLSMRNYSQAQAFATACLNLNSSLIDYNTILTSASRPFPPPLTADNKEVIFYATLNSYSFNRAATTYVNADLYNAYNSNDLRKTAYFNMRGTGYNFKGTYTGNVSFFAGLATDEIYFIRAECEARLNNLTEALTDLNTVMALRFVNGTYTNYTTTDPNQALIKILLERRKELISRGVRWYDLKRLNREASTAVTLSRSLRGQNHTLLPNSNRYVFPIPDDEIAANGLPQNPR
ncbi:SusD family protein [Pedobacter westerhofensis]|uniref:SusD family protein n=2 Tax=Pedobacter westerhofensis TaxID=425512 RepID=A0A521DPH7_9SPHI|nr:SusD family protein [Pedobacter westerhofensis]